MKCFLLVFRNMEGRTQINVSIYVVNFASFYIIIICTQFSVSELDVDYEVFLAGMYLEV